MHVQSGNARHSITDLDVENLPQLEVFVVERDIAAAEAKVSPTGQCQEIHGETHHCQQHDALVFSVAYRGPVSCVYSASTDCWIH